MKKWTLKKRIGVGFAAVCLAMILLGGFSQYAMQIAAGNAERMEWKYRIQSEHASKMLKDSSDLAIAMRGYEISSSEEDWKKIEVLIVQTDSVLKEAAAFSEQNADLVTFAELLAKVQASYKRYKVTVKQFRDSAKEFEEAWAPLVPAGNSFFQASSALLDESEHNVETLSAASKQAEVVEASQNLKAVGAAFRDAGKMRIACYRARTYNSPEAAEEANRLAQAIAVDLRKLQGRAKSVSERKNVEEALKAVASYEACSRVFLQAVQDKNNARVERSKTYAVLVEGVTAIKNDASDSIARAASESTKLLGRSSTILLVGGCIAVVFGVAYSVFVTKNIDKILSEIAKILSTSADETQSSSRAVASSSQQLASGASEQAASLEETSSSLEEMSSMTRRNAEHADKASALTKQARNTADLGVEDMRSMSKSMMEIKDSSDEIAKIIKTIDEIAFQTNILALNAAVEAARAGESGAGFAVVAEEVRALAQRSAASATEIAAKIETALGKIAGGVRTCEKVDQSLAKIVEQVRSVDGLVMEVAVASKEQSDGLTQVNTAVTQMDRVTQSNAASAEEGASAAEELHAQAEALRRAVDDLLFLIEGKKR